MPQIRRSVTSCQKPSSALPQWLSEGALVLNYLVAHQRLQGIAQRLRVVRQGGYCGVDIVIFLVLFFCCRLSLNIKDFGQKVTKYTRQLGALGGRCKLPSPSSVSRFLSAVHKQQVQPFSDWLLLEGCAPENLLQHPLASYRDTCGDTWHLFDWDPTVTALRHRALPQGEELPMPHRRSEDMGSPGYMGRKRGEIRFSRVTVQHSGTGLWVYASLTDARGDTAAELSPALDAIARCCKLAGIGVQQAVVRSDGGAGSVGWMTRCQAAGAYYLTRLSQYNLLGQDDVRRHLSGAIWEQVPSSGSGPGRVATEIGEVVLRASKGSRGADGDPLEPLPTRVVVSRFRSAEKSGAGVLIDGWQYELFGTNLSSQAFPAAELVQLYYGRCAQENRFHQEDREFILDRIFSYNLPGQALAVVIGLFLWNLRTVCGLKQMAPPAQEPQPKPRVSVAVSVPPLPLLEPDAADTPPEPLTGPPPPSAPVSTTDNQTEPEYQEVLKQLDWEGIIKSLPPGWTRSADGLALSCPNHVCLPLSLVTPAEGRRNAKIRFAAPVSCCRSCALRHDCNGIGGDSNRKFAKEVSRIVAAPLALQLQPLLLAERRRRRRAAHVPTSPPPPLQSQGPVSPYQVHLTQGSSPGPCTFDGPYLLPATLRKGVMLTSDQLHITVIVHMPPPAPPSHPALAYNSAERQKRRKSWQQRHAWNELPNDAGVEVTFEHEGEVVDVYDILKEAT